MSGYYPSSYGGPGSTGGRPDPSAASAAVSRMSLDELRGLLDDDDKCEFFVKGLDQIKALYSEKEMLMASNKSLAEYNLSQEDPLTRARCRLQEKHREVRRMAEKVKNLKADVDERSGTTEPDTMLVLLQAAGAEADEESEGLAEEFMKGDKDVDEFLKEFMDKRKLSHMRRIKIDKMKELMEQERRNPQPGATAAGSSAYSSPYPPTGQTTPTRRAPPPPAASYVPPGAPMAAAPNNWGAPPAYPPMPSPYMGGGAPPPAPSQGGSGNLPYPIHPVGMPSGPGY